MKKRELERRITELEGALRRANERIEQLEARPVVAYPPVTAPVPSPVPSSPYPWQPYVITRTSDPLPEQKIWLGEGGTSTATWKNGTLTQ